MKETEVDKGVVTVTLDSWKEFSDFIINNFSNAPAFIFRGQANPEWKLESTLDRMESLYPTKQYFHGKKKTILIRSPLTRDAHLNAFKEMAIGKLGNNPVHLSKDEWWALAQHHGLSTPMLDWTRSPFVALYFSFEEEGFIVDKKWEEPEYRIVFAVPFHYVDIDNCEDCSSPKPFSPIADIGYRLGNQAGLFLKMPKGRDLEAYIQRKFPADSTTNNPNARKILYKILVPNKDRKECLKYLNKMNINRMSLFPDLDGASRYINNLWELDGDTILGRVPSEIE